MKLSYRKGFHFLLMALLFADATIASANDDVDGANDYRILKETGNLISNFKLAQLKAAAFYEAQDDCEDMNRDLVIIQEIATSKSDNNGRAKYELIYQCM